ncbi:MAG TPA: carbohydrate ABC transporter permease [Firmicutes bacterium]|nr:carbohydrate ABC transporter permease [Bacillota bacterium]
MRKNRIRRSDFNPLLRIFTYLVIGVFTLLTLYPLIWLVINSFKTSTEYQRNMLGLPQRLFVRNYSDAWRLANFTTLFLNSLFFTVVSTLSIILLSLAAGFGFAKIRSRATVILHGSFVIGILLTLQSIMIPLFLMLQATGLYDTRIGVLLPYIGMGLPIAIYLCTEFIRGIPDSVVESARIDGASYFKILSAIILPMAKPVAVTLGILNVAGIWNEFMLINILVRSASLRTLPVGIMMFSGPLASDFGKQFAALVIGMAPMIIFYLIFRKQITKGVSAGAIKG